MKKYDTFRIRPDMAKLGPDGEIEKIYDYKFDYHDGGYDEPNKEQMDLYSEKSRQKSEIINSKEMQMR